MISGDVSKYLKEFFIRGRYETPTSGLSHFPLTMPSRLSEISRLLRGMSLKVSGFELEYFLSKQATKRQCRRHGHACAVRLTHRLTAPD
jgi:hypothetical protein